jgi:hypothetical protein
VIHGWQLAPTVGGVSGKVQPLHPPPAVIPRIGPDDATPDLERTAPKAQPDAAQTSRLRNLKSRRRAGKGGRSHLSRLSATGTLDKYQFDGFLQCQLTDRTGARYAPTLVPRLQDQRRCSRQSLRRNGSDYRSKPATKVRCARVNSRTKGFHIKVLAGQSWRPSASLCAGFTWRARAPGPISRGGALG